MTRAVRALALAAILAAPTRGLAFIRSTRTNGACLAWPQRHVEFAVNPEGLPGQQPVCTAGAPLDELTAALAAWVEAARPGGMRCTDLQLGVASSTTSTEIGTAPNGPDANLIVWRRGDCNAIAPPSDSCWSPDAGTSCATKYNCWEDGDDRTIALTWTSYVVSTGEIVDADIELRAWDGGGTGFDRGVSGWYFTCFDPRSAAATTCTRYGESGCVGMDLRSVLAHELGHAIGIRPVHELRRHDVRVRSARRDLEEDARGGRRGRDLLRLPGGCAHALVRRRAFGVSSVHRFAVERRRVRECWRKPRGAGRRRSTRRARARAHGTASTRAARNSRDAGSAGIVLHRSCALSARNRSRISLRQRSSQASIGSS